MRGNKRDGRGSSYLSDDDNEDDIKVIGTSFGEGGSDAIWKADSSAAKILPGTSSSETKDDPTHGGKRFHGAFTGGFTAGYFNTVGTKEGWTPSTFSSSRSNRAEQKLSRPEDFMDSEDLGEQAIAGHTLRARSDFNLPDSRLSNKSDMDSRMQQVLVAPSDSVGVQLLRQMGWREGQGVGANKEKRQGKVAPRVYGASLPPHMRVAESTSSVPSDEDLDVGEKMEGIDGSKLEAQEAVSLYRAKRKDDEYGLGFDIRKANPEMHSSSALAFRGESSNDAETGGIGPGSSSRGLSLEQKAGGAFGLGALEFTDGDEDIYKSDSLSNYDIELTTERSHSRFDREAKTRQGAAAAAASGQHVEFVPAQARNVPVKTWPRLAVPGDYVTMHRWQGPALELTPDVQLLASKFLLGAAARVSFAQAATPMDHMTRANLLGEAALPVRHAPSVSASNSTSTAGVDRPVRKNRAAKWDVKPEQSTNAQPLTFGLMSESDRLRVASTLASNFEVSNVILPEEPAGLVMSSAERQAAREKAELQFPTEPEKQGRWLHYLAWCRSQGQEGQQSERAEFDALIARHKLVKISTVTQQHTPKLGPLPPGAVAISGIRDRATRFIDEAVAGTTAEKIAQKSEVEYIKAAAQGQYGPLTRDTKQWRPERLLCKRFNLPDPYEGVAPEDVDEKPLTASEQQFNEMLEAAQAHNRSINSSSSQLKDNRQRLEKKRQEGGPRPTYNPASFRSSSSSTSSSSAVSSFSSSQLFESLAKPEMTSESTASEARPNALDPVPGMTVTAEESAEKPPADLFKAIFLSEDGSDSDDDGNGESDSKAPTAEDAGTDETPGLLALPVGTQESTEKSARPAGASRWGLHGESMPSVHDPLPRLMGREYPKEENAADVKDQGADQLEPAACKSTIVTGATSLVLLASSLGFPPSLVDIFHQHSNFLRKNFTW
eukprot:g17898.t1